MIHLQCDKAQYKPGDNIQITLEAADYLTGTVHVEWTVMELHKAVRSGSVSLPDGKGGFRHMLNLLPFEQGEGAYGLFATARDEMGNAISGEIAFDVAEHWREAPRYGFLSDFMPGDEDDSDIAFLRRHHINIVQFYDWMYRHDQLVPEAEDEFTEPLGRRISLQVVKRKIAELNGGGMDAIAYAAVYASLKDYAEEHPEQLLYNNSGEPYKLGDYYYIMDISEGSAWTEHMMTEYKKVIALGFDGLHLDQYGFPKKAIRREDGKEEVVHLKDCYPAFINETRDVLPSAGIIFNNVSNYPIHRTAGTNQDAMYIEVWDPVTSIAELKQNIDQARELSGKHVILAAYLPCFQQNSPVPQEEAEIGARLTMATIFASGGYHLLLGEHHNVLADSYYPNYGSVSERFGHVLTKYYDFIVMYRNLLFDLQLEDISMTFAGGINTEIVFSSGDVQFAPNLAVGSVWNIVKEKPGYTVIHLINCVGLDNVSWHAGKSNPPVAVEAIEVKVEMIEEVEGVYWASTDHESMQPQELSYTWTEKGEHQGRYLTFTVPSLAYWSMIYIKTNA